MEAAWMRCVWKHWSDHVKNCAVLGCSLQVLHKKANSPAPHRWAGEFAGWLTRVFSTEGRETCHRQPLDELKPDSGTL